MLQYFPLVKIGKLLHYNHLNINIVGHYTDRQYNNLGEYCGPHTASSVHVFLTLMSMSRGPLFGESMFKDIENPIFH